jgi:hypothetical protein
MKGKETKVCTSFPGGPCTLLCEPVQLQLLGAIDTISGLQRLMVLTQR